MKPRDLQLRGFKVAILACDGFEESEMVKPKKAFEAAKATVHIISPTKGKIRSWSKGTWGKSYPVTVALSKANPKDYDAILLPGGVINPDRLRTYKKAINFIDHFFKEHKPVAAICHGPLVLVETGRLENRQITSYNSIKTDLLNAGANWVNRKVVIDHHLVTSRKPQDLPAFNKALIKLFMKENIIKHHQISQKILNIIKKPFIK